MCIKKDIPTSDDDGPFFLQPLRVNWHSTVPKNHGERVVVVVARDTICVAGCLLQLKILES